MLKYKKGCLIKAAKSGEVDVIAHQCNCFNNMGAGIAPQIKKAFPEAWSVDSKTIKGNRSKLGRLTIAFSGSIIVFNLYGQYRYGAGVHTDYTALRSSLYHMRKYLNLSPNYRVGLPKLGCGLGGGDWSIVSKIIEEELNGFDVTIYEL